jgi:hypothetical protein
LIATPENMAFKIIQHFKDQVPSMATCTECHYEFVTPNTLKTDRGAAELYLAEKFGMHQCGSALIRPPDRRSRIRPTS